MRSIRSKTRRPTITSFSPGWKFRPSVTVMPCRTLNAICETPRTVELTSLPSLRRRFATATSSGEASARLFSSRATRASSVKARTPSRPIADVSSEFEPRCVTMAFAVDPVALSATRKPFAMEMSTMSTAITSAMAPTASAVILRRTYRLRML